MTQHPTEIQYTFLGVGDVRQEGDEYRHKYGGGKYRTEHQDGYWHPVHKLGLPIEASDLFAAEFRREVK